MLDAVRIPVVPTCIKPRFIAVFSVAGTVQAVVSLSIAVLSKLILKLVQVRGVDDCSRVCTGFLLYNVKHWAVLWIGSNLASHRTQC